MKYRQKKVADNSGRAFDAFLHVEGRWVPGKLLDKDLNEMPFPCDLKAGETYFVEVDAGKEAQ